MLEDVTYVRIIRLTVGELPEISTSKNLLALGLQAYRMIRPLIWP